MRTAKMLPRTFPQIPSISGKSSTLNPRPSHLSTSTKGDSLGPHRRLRRGRPGERRGGDVGEDEGEHEEEEDEADVEEEEAEG